MIRFESNFNIQFFADEYRFNSNSRIELLIDAICFARYSRDFVKSLNNELQTNFQIRIFVKFNRFFVDFDQILFLKRISNKSFKFEN